MSEPREDSGVPTSFPISVVLRRKEVHHGRWSLPHWEAVAAVVGEHIGSGERQRALIHSEAGVDEYLWTGLTLELHKSEADSYWYNLVGTQPSLFVVCSGEGDELAPRRITADYHEAGRHIEVNDTVFAVPLPAEMYRWLERYVVENYVPEEPKKRKKEDWAKGSLHGREPEDKGGRSG